MDSFLQHIEHSSLSSAQSPFLHAYFSSSLTLPLPIRPADVIDLTPLCAPTAVISGHPGDQTNPNPNAKTKPSRTISLILAKQPRSAKGGGRGEGGGEGAQTSAPACTRRLRAMKPAEATSCYPWTPLSPLLLNAIASSRAPDDSSHHSQGSTALPV
ncbi:hypothetical protein SODALDRAFT_362935 [Sodiomyces alkalinus F11]|uniref:Uncharacterized protein n=1 Tax=Sodiomyces alkalinus (strain CBS 110278 / VKM F-3762 / F11) TaxID=1314773 RepID=A0A3N2PNJ8_SODAK|nr:hypothetical protein SODALDRAFT_362935 [Sodiomyces alkalinus F11]ROT36072.1 hypothetical protein SODALDRAFT_362935 [Sodiomyces alkalinus F11]